MTIIAASATRWLKHLEQPGLLGGRGCARTAIDGRRCIVRYARNMVMVIPILLLLVLLLNALPRRFLVAIL